MVVPVREVVNKHCSFFLAFSTNPTITSYLSNIEMCGINDSKLREHSAISNKCSSREFSIFLSISSISYHRKMEINNEHPKEDSTNSVDSSQPFYAEIAKIDDLVSLATDKEIASNSQCVNNKVPALNKVPKLHSKGKGK